jgi:hypothetical protein
MAQLLTTSPDTQQPPVTPPSANRNPHGSTGPKTAAGKAIVSRNATTHGSSASYQIVDGSLTPASLARLVLQDESREDWEALYRSWNETYQPDSLLAADLVTRVAVADWVYQRTVRRYDQYEAKFNGRSIVDWTEDEHRHLERCLRYQTRAERSFYRARTALETWRRECKRDAEKLAAAGPAASPASTAKATASSKTASSQTSDLPRPARPAALVQCITVQVVDGVTRTLFHPKSEAFANIVRSLSGTCPVVKRAVYFTCDPPPEYHWLASGPASHLPFHIVLERTPEEALADLERESLDGSGHVLEVA